jgi:hypothetical protein
LVRSSRIGRPIQYIACHQYIWGKMMEEAQRVHIELHR